MCGLSTSPLLSPIAYSLRYLCSTTLYIVYRGLYYSTKTPSVFLPIGWSLCLPVLQPVMKPFFPEIHQVHN
jgi:hypothetical protein